MLLRVPFRQIQLHCIPGAFHHRVMHEAAGAALAVGTVRHGAVWHRAIVHHAVAEKDLSVAGWFTGRRFFLVE